MDIYKNLSIENIDGEVWVSVKGYEGIYEISNKGRLKRFRRGVSNGYQIIRQTPHYKRGYLMASLHLNREEKKVLIHRLVALHFIPNHKNFPQVNHKLGDKNDNRAESLEWMNNSENQKHSYGVLGRISHRLGKNGTSCGRSKKIKRIASDGAEKIFESACLAAKELSGSHSGISAVARGEQKTAYGYKWEYIT